MIQPYNLNGIVTKSNLFDAYIEQKDCTFLDDSSNTDITGLIFTIGYDPTEHPYQYNIWIRCNKTKLFYTTKVVVTT